MRYILRASRCIEPMTWLRFWRQLRNPLRWNLHIRPPSPGSSEPILFIDSGRVGYALWGTIVWPLDVSHMNYRELPFYVARTCLTFKTPPAASSTQAIPQIFFFWIYKIQSPSLCFGILRGMCAQHRMANAWIIYQSVLLHRLYATFPVLNFWPTNFPT